jgi:sialidase-1
MISAIGMQEILPADVDVGRFPQQGWWTKSWEPMIVAMDMGNDPKFGYDGVGDPAVLADPVTAPHLASTPLWSHGNRGWNGSRPGLKPEETGQFMICATAMMMESRGPSRST